MYPPLEKTFVDAHTKERYGDAPNGCGSNIQSSNWEADTLPLKYRRPPKKQKLCLTKSLDLASVRKYCWVTFLLFRSFEKSNLVEDELVRGERRSIWWCSVHLAWNY